MKFFDTRLDISRDDVTEAGFNGNKLTDKQMEYLADMLHMIILDQWQDRLQELVNERVWVKRGN